MFGFTMRNISSSDLQSTARAYEALLVPALFQPWADLIAHRAEIQSTDRVLDIACGTGVLTRAIARRLDASGSVTGLDLNPGMLAVAEERAPHVTWHQGDAASLPFDDRSFDVVVSQFGLMLFASPDTALQEMRRVLRPGGRLLVAVFDDIDRLPAFATAADIYASLAGPAVGRALRLPFSMGDPRELEHVFSRAGIPDPGIQTHEGTARFDSIRHMMLADVKGWFPFAGIHLDDETIEAIEARMTSQLREYVRPDGTVHVAVSVHLVHAHLPAAGESG